ncbi:MAG: peptidylprolyl isomerase [Alphaproteobacteria bacterium]|nr:peptidylprolyl isomerase [Alphaproteobacteria bacterium]
MFSTLRTAARGPLVIAGLTAGLLLAGPALAQTGTQPSATPTQLPDPMKTVVARVMGEEIFLAEILRMAERLPEQYKKLPLPAVYPSLLQRSIDARLVAAAGYAAGYADNEEVKNRLKAAESQIISEIYLTDAVGKRITEDALREEYERRKAKMTGGDQIKARHILLESEEDARAVIEELNKGGDFGELAADKSTGPSASNGGDLGWFGEGQMVPEFSEAAFGMEPGNFTTEPVKTQFGWHVILVEDRKASEPPTFEQTRQQLSSEMSGTILQEMLGGLREKTEVERFNFDGGPMPEGPVPTPKN